MPFFAQAGSPFALASNAFIDSSTFTMEFANPITPDITAAIETHKNTSARHTH